ncbi:MAG: DUF4829 domain-containing protein [Clostridiaceae bacterium]|nr:DUF4829 domain-containing protein [Clostridiaceae bacterium]
MKKIIVSLCFAIFLLSLNGCNNTKVSNDLNIEIGKSTKFSQSEINDAIDCVKDNFDFKACTLTKLWYEEKQSNSLVDAYLNYGRGSVNDVKNEDVIVILSNFVVDDSGDNPVFNSNSSYTNYSWTLIRKGKNSKWEIDDCGY